MALDSVGLKRASDRLARQKEERAAFLERRRRTLFQEIPELEEIDRQLRKTMVEVLTRCLRSGTDPQPALRKIREQNLSLQARQAQLLAGHGLPPDALDQTPSCKLCRDSGWNGGQMCQCLKKFYIEEELALLRDAVDLEEQTFARFSLDWYSPLPQAGRGRSPRENMEAVRDMCQMYAARFGHFPVKNLFLTGDPGLGKTFLSACIAKAVAEQGFWVIYVTADELFSSFRDRNYSGGEEREKPIRRFLLCDLLLLDDLGSEWTVPSAQAALYTVVNDRLRGGKCTVISSNLGVEGLIQTYSGQTVSRIRGEYRTLEFFGEDIRALRKKQR